MDEKKLRALGDEIAVTMAAIDRTEHRLLGLLRQFDNVGGWAVDGATSVAAWLSHRTGMSPVTARERVRVAHALTALPAIDRAFCRGHISYSKARAVTRVANAENDEMLVTMARGMTAAELEKLCRMMRSAETGTGVESAAAEPQRAFSQRTDASGMVRMAFKTSLDNLVSLCRTHHRFLREGGGSVESVAGGFVFRNRAGEVIPRVPTPPYAEPLCPDADAWTAVAKSDGHPLD